MTANGPVYVIDAPPLGPPPMGLLLAAQVIEHGDDDYRWGNRIEWVPENCGDGQVFDPCGPNPLVATTFTDGVTTNGSNVFTSATANFSAVDFGMPLVAAGVPAGATITGVTNATTVTLSANATATAAGVSFSIPNRRSPRNRAPIGFYDPFGVDAYDECSAFGFEVAEYEARARRALANRETKLVEREFWTGTLVPGNVHLAAAGTKQLQGGAIQSDREALALLCQEIADSNGGRGMIHARPGVVQRWFGLGELRYESGKLYTAQGHVVVPGVGYTGSSPAGVAANQTDEWAYCTGPIQVHRGPVEVFASEADRQSSFDENTNMVTVRAQRLYGIAFNGCTLAGVQLNPLTTGT